MKLSPTLLTATILTAVVAAGCAGGGNRRAAEADAPPPARAEREAPPPKKGVTTAPAGSPLAKITRGMPDHEVRRILGEPDSQRQYETGKRWIPGYGAAGQDNFRTEYVYKRLGRVTFSRNDYTGSLKVLRVDYDPNL